MVKHRKRSSEFLVRNSVFLNYSLLHISDIDVSNVVSLYSFDFESSFILKTLFGERFFSIIEIVIEKRYKDKILVVDFLGKRNINIEMKARNL